MFGLLASISRSLDKEQDSTDLGWAWMNSTVLAWTESDCAGLGWAGLGCAGLGWAGWPGLAWTELDCAGLVRVGGLGQVRLLS